MASNVVVNFLANVKNFRSGTDDMGRAVGGVTGTLGRLGSVVGGLAIANKMREAGQAAVDFQDKVSGAASIIGADYEALKKQANSFQFIPPSVAALAQQQFSVAAKAMGMTGQAGVDLNQKLLETAQAMTVVTGIPIAEVTTGISAAFRGEYDSIQRLVPGINGAMVQTEALAMSGKKSASQLTEQEKSQAALNLILRSGADYQKQLGENTGTAAAKQKAATAEMERAKIEMGEKMLPVMAKVATVVSTLASVFSSLPGPVQTAIVVGGGLLGVLATLLPILTTLGGVVIPLLVTAFWGITAPVAGVVAAIAAAIAIGVLIVKNWDTIKNAAGAVGRFVGDVFSVMGRTIGAVWDGVKSKAVTAINFLIDMFNKYLRVMSAPARLLGNLPGLGFLSSIGNLQIPRLAKGGIVTGPTLALIGEAGPERVQPLTGPNRPRGGEGLTIIVQGSVTSEYDLVRTIRDGLAREGRVAA